MGRDFVSSTLKYWKGRPSKRCDSDECLLLRSFPQGEEALLLPLGRRALSRKGLSPRGGAYGLPTGTGVDSLHPL